MFIDASALVAILVREAEASDFSRRARQAVVRYTSPMAIYEAVLAVSRARRISVDRAENLVERLLAAAGIQNVPISAEIGRLAIEAFARFGRGKHPARLNMGDCFAYACARSLGVPMLCKGGDFAQTDIELA
ncbi:MAG: type II toxin-antitoxin system VapC family toxin [Stellaceae bacterium]